MMPRRGFAPMLPLLRPAGGGARAESGINENYARELMELHTLGVDGGYTQQDVIEVARILTGWGVTQPKRMGDREVRVPVPRLGARLRAPRRSSAWSSRRATAWTRADSCCTSWPQNPATARHISHQLCARFVADTPPDGCVDAAVAAWQRTDGDIRAVLVAIATSPDFWAPENRTAKFKAPLEFVASAVRALDGEPDTTTRLVRALQQLGEPLFMHLTPDGYPDVGGGLAQLRRAS